MKRFRYGLCEWSVREKGMALCKLAAEHQLDCLQLGIGEEIFNQCGLGSNEVIEEYKKGAGLYGIEISSLSPQFVDQYSFTAPNSRKEEQIAVRLVEKTIELCGTFGCKSFLLPVLGKNNIFDGTSFHRAVEYIKKFSNQAAEQGIETYLEINQSVDEVHNLLDAVDNPMVKIFFDSQNLFALNGTSMARYFTEIEELIGGIHLKDGVDSMLSGSLLGEGNSGFYKTAKAILDSKYSGTILIESVYHKAAVCTKGPESELLARDAATLHKVFG